MSRNGETRHICPASHHSDASHPEQHFPAGQTEMQNPRCHYVRKDEAPCDGTITVFGRQVCAEGLLRIWRRPGLGALLGKALPTLRELACLPSLNQTNARPPSEL